jgi:hypothetical protein
LSYDYLPHGTPSDRHRHSVIIEAYVRLSDSDEMELFGIIGESTFTAESKKRFRHLVVDGSIGGQLAVLRYGRLSLRSTPVSGEVMGQSISGNLEARDGGVTLRGMAGREPLHYEIDPGGGTSAFGRPLGTKVVHQAFYSELIGGVDRQADAAMVALLLPLYVTRREAELGF